jgi:copper chaperone NosL
MRHHMTIMGLVAFLLMIHLAVVSFAAEPVKLTGKEKCPVCGMFTRPYPKWLSQIVFKDGTYAVFDGAKCMFKYYFNTRKYNKDQTREDIDRMFCTEYYTTRSVNAIEVYFILGSDVLGPMGHELVPVRGETEAKGFMKDHGGTGMLSFEEITAGDIPR